MSPAQDILTRMGFKLVGPLKGAPDLDLWEYIVEFAPEQTVHAPIPRTPDAGVSYAVQALVEFGAARQRRVTADAYDRYLNTLKSYPTTYVTELAESPL